MLGFSPFPFPCFHFLILKSVEIMVEANSRFLSFSSQVDLQHRFVVFLNALLLEPHLAHCCLQVLYLQFH